MRLALLADFLFFSPLAFDVLIAVYFNAHVEYMHPLWESIKCHYVLLDRIAATWADNMHRVSSVNKRDYCTQLTNAEMPKVGGLKAHSSWVDSA
jgi:hypothetical protein